MTIGGNDNNTFIGAIAECGAAGLSTLGQGSPCRDQYGNQFRHDIRHTTYPALVKALKAVHRRAPHARVAILGYPWILPKTDGCFDKMPVAKGDVPYLRRVQATLNNAVRRAAGATGSTYVGFGAGLRGPRRLPADRACAGSSRCSRAPTRSSSTRTRWARSTWRSGR